MASSSIEVMGVGGGEVKVMLMDDSVGDDGEVDEELQTIITASADDNGQMVTSVEAQQTANHSDDGFGMEGEFTTLEGMEPPPGTIIFSPQDLLRPSKPAFRSNKGRGLLRPGLAPIKHEPNVPPTYGSAGDMEVPVACEVCGKVMMTGKTLVQHMAIHSDLKPFQCPHCPKSFARKVHLQGHLVVHGIEKQFECPVCHQRFSRQDCVKVHMRLHDKSKCVYCDVCHKAFLTVGALNIHLRIHRGEKPFKCHLCSKCFTQKNHLITHIKRHTKVTDDHFTKKLGPRMFKCEHCPRSFIRLSDYERHVQWNHGAVAEGSIVDKLPTVGNLLDGELKQTGLAPQIFKAPKDALNSRPRVRRPRKVMCTASTQTDEDGGRIIVPRQYQVSAATQVSAPPTPRHDEDMYENDIFDEGMDRNYSSDEDEVGRGDMEGDDPLEQKAFSMPATAEMASDPIQDAAFDAIVQGKEAPRMQVVQDVAGQDQAAAAAAAAQDKHSEFLEEVVNSMVRQAVLPPHPTEDPGADRLDGAKENSNSIELPEVRMVPGIAQPASTMATAKSVVTARPAVAKEAPVKVKKEPVGVLPIKLINPPKRGRGRGRGRKWSPYGLSGAAELRAIRMSLMKNIISAEEERATLEEEEAMREAEEAAEAEAEAAATATAAEGTPANSGPVEEVETEGRGKRLAKNKQHGKDFVCNMKNCEICCPPQARPPRPPTTTTTQATATAKMKVKVKQESIRKPPPTAPKTGAAITASASQADSVHGLLSLAQGHLLKTVKVEQGSSAAAAAGPAEETKMKVGNRVGSYPVDITANPLAANTLAAANKREDYFVTSSSGSASVVSPPVELMSFCIPTYSCKLCSREFRFEGKLHRHIESVHQNKAIFSPDVKPGRGNAKMYQTGPSQGSLGHQFITAMPSASAGGMSQLEHENPEIAALRSEWDDDEDDDPEPDGRIQAAPGHPPMTIVTRDIAPVTTTVTDAYSGGVKVNMNKLAGLLPQVGKNIPLAYEAGRIKPANAAGQGGARAASSAAPREPETIMADTLDMKCRRLLEKLFDQDLLLQCGLLEDHVSVVLGKVLQHYGVKMIEDYGQGQYEVLKYNLWRLIEWKVTMEQMEEFYTEGKSVEEMMDDIMHERVPVVSHHFVPRDQAAATAASTAATTTAVTTVAVTAGQAQPQGAPHVETVDMSEGQVVLQHVAGVLGGQISLPEGVTQVVLSQDMSPDLLQGAHIVTIDPTTGQVISQVTADQVILADAIGDDLEQQVSALDGQVVVSQGQLGGVPQGTIVATHPSGMSLQHGQVLVQEADGSTHQVVKMEAMANTTAHHH